MLLACLLLWLGESDLTLVLFFILFGLGSGMLQPMINSLLAERYGTEWLGEIKSITMPLNVISSAFSPFLMGLMIDSGANLNQLMLLLILTSAFSLIVSFVCFNLLGMVNPSKKCFI
jgi:MFS family permease